MNKGMFWLVWGVGALPMLLAMGMYFGQVGVPDGRMNHGDLLPPGAELEEWEIEDAAGEQWVHSGDWHLLLTYDECDRACDSWKTMLPNLHQALGRERDRVQWHVLSGHPATNKTVLVSGRIGEIGSAVWVADPLGNLVMRFPLDQNPRDLLLDLKRMLKLSKIG
ncbi:MAG: hypothetical protein KC477_12760 [Oceanospirillaceae bacterium]|nr:hypothetical protein [Oceanospirillaceae bacterium]